LLVGLEIKRELLDGELTSRQQALLPAVAALSGFVAALPCGIGFTMSLFLGTSQEARLKLGVHAGSFLSALAGAAILLLSARPSARAP
jgi:Na+/H+ antiporter NhaA